MDGLPYPDGVNGSPPPIAYVAYRTLEMSDEQAGRSDRLRLGSVTGASLEPDAEFRASLRLCGDCSESFSTTVDKVNHTVLDLEFIPGRYVLTIAGTSPGPENAVTFEIQ